MSNGYCGASAVVVEKEFVKEICGVTLENLYSFLEKNDLMEEGEQINSDIVDSISNEDYSGYEAEFANQLKSLVGEVRGAFKEKTGLDLNLGYTSFDNDDGVDFDYGMFFQVDFADVYCLTPEAKKIEDKIEFHRWAYYG